MFNDRCFICNEPGHIAINCPQKTAEPPKRSAARPAWCGECNRQTRLVDCGVTMERCTRCHPLAHESLRQHKRCGGCGMIIYKWDVMKCGEHQAPPDLVARFRDQTAK